MTAKSVPGQQNKVWPPAATDPGVAALEPLLLVGDTYYNTSTFLIRKCDDPSVVPAVWSDVGASSKSSFTGGTNHDETLIDVEVVMGGFVFDGSTTLSPVFRFVGIFLPATSGNARVRLYDTGPVSGPAIAPELRSELEIAYTAGGAIVDRQKGQVKSAAPGIDADEIFNTERIYELRVILDGATPGDAVKIHWAGIEVS